MQGWFKETGALAFGFMKMAGGWDAIPCDIDKFCISCARLFLKWKIV